MMLGQYGHFFDEVRTSNGPIIMVTALAMVQFWEKHPSYGPILKISYQMVLDLQMSPSYGLWFMDEP